MKLPPINIEYLDSLMGLYEAVGSSTRGLEIGLGWGTSTQAYLDYFEGSVLDSIEQADFHGAFEPLKNEYGDRLFILVGRSPEVYSKRGLSKYDFIYIDAAHDTDSVKLDISNTWIHLLDGGVMAFDDYGIEGMTEEGKEHGVKTAVDEVFKGKKPIFHERGVIAFRKE